MQKGDFVEVVDNGNPDVLTCHLPIGTICKVIEVCEPNELGEVVYIADNYDVGHSDYNGIMPCAGQYVNSCSLKLIDLDDEKTKIQLLRQFGYGLVDCKNALKKCSSLDSALGYLMIRGLCVARYKIINGKKEHWIDSDYVAAAERDPANWRRYFEINYRR